MLAFDNERRDKPKDRTGSAVNDSAAFHALADDFDAGFFRFGKLETENQAFAAHFANLAGMFLLKFDELAFEVAANFFDVVQKFFSGNGIKHDVGGCAGEGVAAESCTVVAGVQSLRDFFSADECADWNAASQTFRQRHDVGLDAVFLVGEKFTAAPDTRLNFVENQKRAVLIAELADFLQIIVFGRENAAFALNRLKHDGAGFIADFPFEFGNVVVVYVVETGGQRLKATVIFRLTGSGKRSQRPAVETVPRGYNLRFVGVELVGVLAGDFDSAFVSLRAGISEKCAV